ncbi:MAG: hypothetical protein KJT03_10220, partial [Verrucomicrobiae bacterium]|nr:hypothetical protein [Verrucomicrobiae bacterium]
MAFHGQWESAYIIQVDQVAHNYLMDLNSTPLWSQPNLPTFTDFSDHFSGSSLPEGGEIMIYHKWDWWFLDLFLIWLIGSMVIAPISFIVYPQDRTLGVIARIGAGLIAFAPASFILWVAAGGWGPPAPLFFATLGLLFGGTWAVVYAKKDPKDSK